MNQIRSYLIIKSKLLGFHMDTISLMRPTFNKCRGARIFAEQLKSTEIFGKVNFRLIRIFSTSFPHRRINFRQLFRADEFDPCRTFLPLRTWQALFLLRPSFLFYVSTQRQNPRKLSYMDRLLTFSLGFMSHPAFELIFAVN